MINRARWNSFEFSTDFLVWLKALGTFRQFQKAWTEHFTVVDTYIAHLLINILLDFFIVRSNGHKQYFGINTTNSLKYNRIIFKWWWVLHESNAFLDTLFKKTIISINLNSHKSIQTTILEILNFWLNW